MHFTGNVFAKVSKVSKVSKVPKASGDMVAATIFAVVVEIHDEEEETLAITARHNQRPATV